MRQTVNRCRGDSVTFKWTMVNAGTTNATVDQRCFAMLGKCSLGFFSTVLLLRGSIQLTEMVPVQERCIGELINRVLPGPALGGFEWGDVSVRQNSDGEVVVVQAAGGMLRKTGASFIAHLKAEFRNSLGNRGFRLCIPAFEIRPRDRSSS